MNTRCTNTHSLMQKRVCLCHATKAWEAKQVCLDEGWDEREIERWMGKGEEEESRDCGTREMSPVCLAVAVKLQGTAVTQ